MDRMNLHLAHDMRTPLQLINSCAQMIQAELDDPSQPASRYARLLMENVQYLNDMVTAQLDEACGCSDVVHLARSLCRRMDGEAVARGVVLLFSSNTAALRMQLDSTKFVRALQNLVANALRFTPEGGMIRVQIKTRGDTVEVSVSDTGPGIDPARQKRIFSPGETQGGYGLGLSIVRRLVKQMGGCISTESTPGKGAVFVLRLPIRGN